MASVVQLVGLSSHNQKVAGSIPHQGTYLDCRFDPRPGAESKQLMPLPSSDVSFTPFLSKNNEKKFSLGEDSKKKAS